MRIPAFARLLALVAALSLGFASLVSAQSAPRVRVDTTLGSFTLELDPQRSPLTVASFLEYVKAGQYTDTVFHRVIGNFVVQGGGFDTKYVEKPTRPSTLR